jgi:hypothetical protein
MKKLLILLVIMVIPRIAFSQTEWSELYYHYQTGSVPPAFYYSYDITVGSGGTVTLVYRPGYQPDSSWTYTFTYPIDTLARLNKAINESGILTETILEEPAEKRPIGGPIQNITILLSQSGDLDQMPKKINITSFPDEIYKKKLNAVYEQVTNLIPKETWDAISARREAKAREDDLK